MKVGMGGHKLAVAALAAACVVTANAASTIEVQSGETYSFDNTECFRPAAASTTVIAHGGSTLVLPDTVTTQSPGFYPQLMVTNGIVRITGSVRNAIGFRNGIRSLAGGSIVFEVAPVAYLGVTDVDSGNVNWPVCDIGNFTFTDTSGAGLILRNKLTVRKLPTTCKVSVAKSGINGERTVLALQGTGIDLTPIGVAPGAITLEDFDVQCCNATCFSEGTLITVKPGASIFFRPMSAKGWYWSGGSYQSGRYKIRLDGKGARVVFNLSGGNWCRCESDVTGIGEVVVKSETEKSSTAIFRGISYTVTGITNAISIPINEPTRPQPGTSWQSKVAHWFDASAEGTLTKFEYQTGWAGCDNTFNGHPIVISWQDKILGTSDIFFRNNYIWNNADPKQNYCLNTMPYVVEGGLNGKNYLCFGTRGNSAAGSKYDSSGNPIAGNELRRLQVWRGGDSSIAKASGAYETFLSPYCIMVFGSQQGGGKAVLGCDCASGHGNFARGGTTTNSPWFYTGNKGFKMYADGCYTDGYTIKPNGGWQVVSIDMTGTNTYIYGLGTHKTNDQHGGQNYAEVIFFREKPTPEERADCERYLASKWGLEDSYFDVAQPTSVKLHGDNKGTVVVAAGQELVLSDRPPPPDESVVPAANRVGWYDPNFIDGNGNPAVDYQTLYEYSTRKPLIAGPVYARTESELLPCSATSPVLAGSINTMSSSYGDRAPWLEKNSARGLVAGPKCNWLNFGELYSGIDSLGQNLRLWRNRQGGSLTNLPTRQAFIVNDTSNGGGGVISDNVDFWMGAVKPRSNLDVSDPIWSPSNTVTMTHTWLDTTEVDGTSHGTAIAAMGRCWAKSFSIPNRWPRPTAPRYRSI